MLALPPALVVLTLASEQEDKCARNSMSRSEDEQVQRPCIVQAA